MKHLRRMLRRWRRRNQPTIYVGPYFNGTTTTNDTNITWTVTK